MERWRTLVFTVACAVSLQVNAADWTSISDTDPITDKEMTSVFLEGDDGVLFVMKPNENIVTLAAKFNLGKNPLRGTTVAIRFGDNPPHFFKVPKSYDKLINGTTLLSNGTFAIEVYNKKNSNNCDMLEEILDANQQIVYRTTGLFDTETMYFKSGDTDMLQDKLELNNIKCQ